MERKQYRYYEFVMAVFVCVLLCSNLIGASKIASVGEGVDSLLFYPIAFYGIWPTDLVIKVMLSNYLIKVGWEAVITPFIYLIVNALKKAEHEDHFDRHTDFNPFTLKA